MYNSYFFESLAFESNKGVLIGEHKGYTYSYTKYAMGYASFDAISIYLGEQASKEVRKAITKRTKLPVYMSNYLSKQDTLIIVFPKKAPKQEINKLNFFIAIRNDVFNILAENGYYPINKCVVCNQTQDEEPVRKVHRNLHVLMHEECAKDTSSHVRQEVIEDEGRSELLMGSILLALFGCLIGMIPIVILLFGAQTYLGILYFIPPFAAFYGYKLGKAPRNNSMIATVVIICFLVVIAFEYMQWVFIAEYEEVSLSVLFAHPEVVAQAIRDFLFSFMFMGIGISVAWRYMMGKTNKSRIKEIETLEE